MKRFWKHVLMVGVLCIGVGFIPTESKAAVLTASQGSSTTNYGMNQSKGFVWHHLIVDPEGAGTITVGSGSSSSYRYAARVTFPFPAKIIAAHAMIGAEDFAAAGSLVTVDLLQQPTGTTTTTSLLTAALTMGTSSVPYTMQVSDNTIDDEDTVIVERYNSNDGATGHRLLELDFLLDPR